MNTVLVVEDDPIQQLIISKLLQRIKLNVIFASDGCEALELVQSHYPELVVLDIIMPQMNGYEVCRRLKANPKTQELAVIMYSNKSEDCDFYWGCKQGADAYVSKLSPPEELVDTIQSLLSAQHKRVQSSAKLGDKCQPAPLNLSSQF